MEELSKKKQKKRSGQVLCRVFCFGDLIPGLEAGL